jgi:hypothetical protein
MTNKQLADPLQKVLKNQLVFYTAPVFPLSSSVGFHRSGLTTMTKQCRIASFTPATIDAPTDAQRRYALSEGATTVASNNSSFNLSPVESSSSSSSSTKTLEVSIIQSSVEQDASKDDYEAHSFGSPSQLVLHTCPPPRYSCGSMILPIVDEILKTYGFGVAASGVSQFPALSVKEVTVPDLGETVSTEELRFSFSNSLFLVKHPL